MRIVIFGTGVFYKNRKENVWKENVVAFLDNAPEKQGTRLDNRMIYAPEKVKDLQYDYILIMTNHKFFVEINHRLLELGIPQQNILSYDEFLDIQDSTESSMRIYCRGTADEIWSGEKRVLLLSHELSNSGAPIVLLNAALVMQKNGYKPVIMSPKDGALRSEIINHGIPVVIDAWIRKKNTFLWNWMIGFDFIWVNTLDFSYLIDDLSESGVQAAWWLHETDISYEIIGMNKMPKAEKLIPTYGVGERAIGSFKKYLKRTDIQNLFYGIPDKSQEKKLTFALIGSISERKGQDIFVDAIELLTEEQKGKAAFKIIGEAIQQHIYDDIVVRSSQIPCLEIMRPLDHDEMIQMYQNIDVVVCPSRMDPMPVVVTEGFMKKKVCIVSDMTGSAGLITDGKNGLVCEVNAKSLSEKIAWVIEHQEELDSIRDEARKLYEEHFSMDVFEKNIMDIICGRETKE